ncbi:SH3 domain-containing protein [Devosia sp.]|uniref:SH3 domain-containing protein n=1 Tax=Devosia sp. TaxID=1871048 RepID=UPI003F71EBD9
MSPARLLICALGALVASGFGMAPALADGAVASGFVNVRAGPGGGHPVVAVLDPGQRVRIDHCRGPWCLIRQAGPGGWVDANYLTTPRHYARHGFVPNVAHDSGSYAGGYYGGERFYDDYAYLEHPHQRYRMHDFYGDIICIEGDYAQVCPRR